MRRLLRIWPWHEHIYSFCGLASRTDFECSCGKTITGDELFSPDTVMGRYWRARNKDRENITEACFRLHLPAPSKL